MIRYYIYKGHFGYQIKYYYKFRQIIKIFNYLNQSLEKESRIKKILVNNNG